MKYINVTDFMIELKDFIYDSYKNTTENIEDNFHFSIDVTSNDTERKIVGLEYKIQSLDKELFNDITIYFYQKYKDEHLDIQRVRNGQFPLNVEINTFINAFKPYLNNNLTLERFFKYMDNWIINYSFSEKIPIEDIFQDYNSEKLGDKSYHIRRKLINKSYGYRNYKA